MAKQFEDGLRFVLELDRQDTDTVTAIVDAERLPRQQVMRLALRHYAKSKHYVEPTQTKRPRSRS